MVRPTEEERFWAKVNKTSTCWLWTASTTYGYGQFSIGTKLTGFRSYRAHRWSYEHLVGPIPDGLQLDHLCRVRNCVRPDHLEAVTSHENTMRTTAEPAINAMKLECKNGHPFDEENTVWYVGPSGPTRRCRKCANAYTRERRRLGLRKQETAEQKRRRALRQRERDGATVRHFKNRPEAGL